MDPQLLALGLVWFVVFVFSTTCHEAGHAWAALKLGDPTAYLGGQVSLNPIPHVQREPFGMVLVPLLSFGLSGGGWMFGWASAPFDPHWAARYPRRSAWMALAGPAANLVLVVLAGLALRIGFAAGLFAVPDPAQKFGLAALFVGTGGATDALATTLSVAFTLNVVLFVFNLIPLPPLDGSGALPLLLPAGWVARYREWFSHPAMGFLGLIVAWRVSGLVLLPALRFAIGLLHS